MSGCKQELWTGWNRRVTVLSWAASLSLIWAPRVEPQDPLVSIPVCSGPDLTGHGLDHRDGGSPLAHSPTLEPWVTQQLPGIEKKRGSGFCKLGFEFQLSLCDVSQAPPLISLEFGL